jgi:hypothetical protein
MKLTEKQLKRLKKAGKLRDPFEIWVDKHNHKLELLRTLISAVGVVLSSLIFLKVFKIF